MKKGWKKLAALGLSVVTAGAMLSGCGSSGSDDKSASSDTKDMPVVNFVMPSFYDFSTAPDVEAKINDILGEKYGIQTKLTYVSIGAWTQQTNLLLTGDECDVVAVFTTPLSTYVNNGQLLALDDYFENASDEMKDTFSEGQMKSTTIDGNIYALSNFKDFAGAIDYAMSEKIVDELGIDVDSIKTMDDIEDVLVKVHEAHPELYSIVPQHDSQMLTGRWTWDDLGVGFASAFTGLPDYGDSTNVECLYEMDDFKTFTEYAHKWYEEGYVMADAMSNTEAGDSLILGGKAFSTFINGSVGKLPEGIVAARVIEPWSTSSAYTGVAYGINANSKNPDASWKLLEAFYTDEDVAKLLVDGIEGTNYVDNSDGTISYPDGVDSSSTTYGGAEQAWLYPNSTLTSPIDTLGDADYFDKLMEFNDNAIESKALGFMFNTSKCADAFSSCSNVHQKYFNALMCGAVDPDEVIPQAIEELKAAGLDEVMKEEQSQLDAFLAE